MKIVINSINFTFAEIYEMRSPTIPVGLVNQKVEANCTVYLDNGDHLNYSVRLSFSDPNLNALMDTIESKVRTGLKNGTTKSDN